MTLIWLIVWFVADHVEHQESLLLDPVNVWTATLILALALDLSASHARARPKGR